MAKPEPALETIRGIDFSSQKTDRRDFDYCEFVNCLFADLSQLNFNDCYFKGCNLSNAKAVGSGLRNCTFKDCKLLGANFAGSKDLTFEVHFDHCLMDYASFDKKKLNKSSFKHCKLHGANFTQADLSKCIFDSCDFYDALFSGTNLGGVDLRNSFMFTIDPELNNIKKAKFALQALPWLLQKHNIIVE